MGYLVDTNVISASAPTTAIKRPDLVEWMDLHSAEIFLSAVTIAEITEGIAKARREGAKAIFQPLHRGGTRVSRCPIGPSTALEIIDYFGFVLQKYSH
jgi:predicted nucleic acid-binding protein